VPDLHIDGIDTAKGLRLSNNNTVMYRSILELFYKDGETKLAQLEGCLRDNDLALYTTYVHALKSACANIGATTISEQAAALETAGNNHDYNYITRHNPALGEGLKKLLASIGREIAGTEAVPDKGSLDKTLLKSKLEGLKSAMASFDAMAIDEFSAALGELARHEEVKESLSAMLNNVLVGMYPEASLQIDEIINKGDF